MTAISAGRPEPRAQAELAGRDACALPASALASGGLALRRFGRELNAEVEVTARSAGPPEPRAQAELAGRNAACEVLAVALAPGGLALRRFGRELNAGG